MNLASLPQLFSSLLKGVTGPAPVTAPAAKNAFQSGVTYEGRVLENLVNGRSLVQVAGQPLNMALPPGTQAGDTLRLTYLYSAPRPTFAVEQQATSALQPVRLSASAQQLTALAQLARPTGTSGPPPTKPTPALILQAGQNALRPILGNPLPLANSALLAGISGSLPGNTFATATALTGEKPVEGALAALATNGTTSKLAPLPSEGAQSQAALPQLLYQTLRESGLFYEAHLERWARGTFKLADLRNEPQARIADDSPMATTAGLTDMTEAAARLAGQQLQLLEGAPFLWQGFAWPGQWLEWQVQEQGTHGQPGEAPSAWATELRLTLPRLGGVSARVSLAGERLVVGLAAGEPGTQEAMRAALPSLEQALKSVGLKPTGLSVGQIDAS